jgi:hypothetical protein
MSLRATSATYPRPLYAALVLVACGTALAVYLLVPTTGTERAAAQVAPAASKTPTAREFAHNFVGTTNAYAAASGDETRIRNADCVQASRGHYMCSYAAKKPGTAPECHIMQARWTPNRASTITVTLAGRTTRCGSLDEALRSLA